MITAILGFIGSIAGLVSDNVRQRREIAAAETANRVRLLQDAQSNNHAWEMASLADKDKTLRWLCFVLFTYPLVWAAFDAQGAAAYFNTTLAALPDWYKQIVFSMVGGIWGVAALKDTVPSLVNQTLQALQKTK